MTEKTHPAAASSAALTSLVGRVGIVTGGARGLGAAMTKLLADDGATVAILGLPSDEPRAQELRGTLNGSAERVVFYESNVGEYERCVAAVNDVIAKHGRIDFLINNAGITADKTLRKLSIEDWHKVLQINLSGPFYMTKAVIEQMIAQSYGRIVNISSVIGLTGNIGQANYASAKAGLLGLTKTVALEMAGRGITCNAIAPGFIKTEMVAAMPEAAIAAATAQTPIGRMGDPSEIARTVRFLIDEKSAFITGATFNINGGIFM